MANGPESPYQQQQPDPYQQQGADPYQQQAPGASNQFTGNEDLSIYDDEASMADYAAGSDADVVKKINRRTTPFGRIAAVLLVGGAAVLAGMYFWNAQRAEEQRARLDEIAQMEEVDQVLASLREMLPKATTSDLRHRIIKNLGHYRDEQSVSLLIDSLDEAGKVRRAAAWALARIGSPEADQAKSKLLEVLPKADERSRAQVVWTLAVLGADSDKATEAIVEQFRKGLLQDLDGFDPKIVADALGPERLASEELIEHEAESVRRLTAHSLAAAASADAIDPLSRLLDAELSRDEKNRSREVIRAAAAGLGRTGRREAAAPLFDTLQRAPNMKQPVLDALKKSTSATSLIPLIEEADKTALKRELVRLLADTHDPRASDKLAELQESEDKEIRQTAAFALADMEDERASEVLLKLVESEDSSVRDRAFGALVKIAHPGMSDKLLTLLDEMEARRASIVRVMGETGNADLGPEIEPVLETADATVAAKALGKLDYDPAYDKLLEDVPRPSDVDMGARTPAERSLEHEDLRRKRRAAIMAMGWYGRPEAVDSLMTVVEDDVKEDYELRAQAARSIGMCADVEQLSKVIDRIKDSELDKRSRRYYVQALWQNPYPELSQEMLGLMQSSDVPISVQRAAALAVGYANDPGNDERLMKMLDNEDTARHAAVAISLGASPEATKKLRKVLANNRDVRDILQQALTNERHRWFEMITHELFESGQVYRRLQTADLLRSGPDKESFGYAWAQTMGALRSGWERPGGASVHDIRMKLYETLTAEDTEYREIAGKALQALPERGLLLRARDEGGAGGKVARGILQPEISGSAG